MGRNSIPQHILERFLLGELPESRMAEINNQLKTDHDLQQCLEKIKESNREILTEYPPEKLADQISRRIQENSRPEPVKEKKKFRLLRSLLYVTPVLATSVLVIVLALPLFKTIHTGGTRTKGAPVVSPETPHLIIHRQTRDKIEVLKDAQTVNPGDLLQIAYVARQKSHGIILSIDGNGTTTLHFPYDAADSTALENKSRILLSNSYELDDAPAFERFFFVTSNQKIDVQKIIKQAEALGKDPDSAMKKNLQLDKTMEQYSFLLIKKASTH